MSGSNPARFDPISINVLIGFLILCVGGGSISGISTIDQIDGWYATLKKPFFNPPNWIFGPVWTILYSAMGVAAWWIWRLSRDGKGIVPVRYRPALLLFLAQLIVNFIWTPVFFGAENLGLALIIIVVMWVLIVLTILAFWRIRKWPAVLMMPYLAWVSFATLLNASLWLLN